MNHVVIKRLKDTVLILLLLATALAGTSAAVTFNLQAGVVAKTMPDGTIVTMWGFGPVGGLITVPGPSLVVPPGDNTLTINLTNNLTVPVSIIISSQPGAMIPTWTDGTTGSRTSVSQRVRSLTHETAPGTTGTYTWTNVNPGTHLYKSGTHQQIQVGMGLYGAVKKDAAAGQVYPGITYVNEIFLLFSEVDPVLNEAVANGSYGPPPAPGPGSAIARSPKYFFINGEPFSYASSPIPAGTTGQRTLLRFLNAGYQDYVPVLQGVFMEVVAEDGHLYPFPKNQYSLQLSPGRTMDAIITNPASGYIPLYDRRLHLTNATTSPGGMLAYLNVASPTQYTLNITKAGTGTGRVVVTSLPGGIDCGLVCTQIYNAGTVLTLLAIPDPGVTFGGWTGVDPGTETLNPATVTMNAAKNVTATFGPGGGGGDTITVTSPNGGESFKRGTTVPITWTYTGNPGAFVNIQLLKGTRIFRITRFRPASIGSGGTGSFNWRISRFFRYLGNDFKIRITSTTVPAATDTSDNDFSITR